MALRAHPEYRQLFADRVQRHFFNEGALTFGRTSEVLDLHAGFIDRAIVGESARWGDLLRPANPYDRNAWLKEVSNLRARYLNQRADLALSQFGNDGLFPDLAAPVFVGSFTSLNLRVLRDDGVVIYLNGVEVARSGFAAEITLVTAETLAEAVVGSGEGTLVEFSVPIELLKGGVNVITAERPVIRVRGDRVWRSEGIRESVIGFHLRVGLIWSGTLW
jgi:hypothetical protein